MRTLDLQELLVFHLLEVLLKVFSLKCDDVFTFISFLMVFYNHRVFNWIELFRLNLSKATIAKSIFIKLKRSALIDRVLL